METNFTEEKWLSVDKNFVYALRDIPWTKRRERPGELGNVFSFKINDDNRLARIGEIEANAALILAAKQMFKAIEGVLANIPEDAEAVVALDRNGKTISNVGIVPVTALRLALKAATTPLK